MQILNNYKDQINAIFSEWIKIIDPKSNWTIEDFSPKTGVIEEVTNPHCWRCVTVNQCWFKNEENKRPIEFDYSTYSYSQIPEKKRGLFHPNCHDKKQGQNVPKVPQIKILDIRAKFNDFFSKKRKTFYNIGYTFKDESDIIKTYIDQVKRKYAKGEYYRFDHTKYGFQINLVVDIVAKNKNIKDVVHFKTGLCVFPNGELRIITVFAGRA